MAKKSIPQLASNPLSPTEIVGADALSAIERKYLDEREDIIERGAAYSWRSAQPLPRSRITRMACS